MREEIIESIKRMSKEDCQDVAETFNLDKCSKNYLRSMALKDENIANYVLMY